MEGCRSLGEKIERLLIQLDDRLLESLGTYFVYHKIHETHLITFEQFIDKWERGVWQF